MARRDRWTGRLLFFGAFLVIVVGATVLIVLALG
jgi:hypothetical protein